MTTLKRSLYLRSIHLDALFGVLALVSGAEAALGLPFQEIFPVLVDLQFDNLDVGGVDGHVR